MSIELIKSQCKPYVIDSSITAKTAQATIEGSPCRRCGWTLRFAKGTNPCVRCTKQYTKEYKRRKNFPYAMQDNPLWISHGFNTITYENILSAQGGSCAICYSPPKPNKRFAVDHCHKTGVFRGLVCSSCNVALGLFKENPEVMLRAIDYLKNNDWSL